MAQKMKSVEDLRKDLELLKTLPDSCYLELGLGAIDLKRFSLYRIKYVKYVNDDKRYFTVLPLLWRKDQEKPWVSSTVEIYSDDEMDQLISLMCYHHSGCMVNDHVEKTFNALRKFNEISERLILEALPEFGWRVIITKETEKVT